MRSRTETFLKEIGVILHKAKSGRLIVRLSKKVQPGSFVLDERGKKLGTVVELIGPVRSPYASVALATSRSGRSDDKVFATG
jgi:rRNA processing protein Gar1